MRTRPEWGGGPVVNRLDITHMSFGALVAVTATALFLVLSGTRSAGGAAVAALLGIVLGTATVLHRMRTPVRSGAVRRKDTGAVARRTSSDRRR